MNIKWEFPNRDKQWTGDCEKPDGIVPVYICVDSISLCVLDVAINRVLQ